MNTLTKCIEELKKEKPDIRYILGMLETYLELSVGHVSIPTASPAPTVIRNLDSRPEEEEKTALAIAYETGKIGKIT